MQAAPELDEQIRRHEGYLTRDAANLPLRLTLGDLYRRAGRLDEAAASYDECERLAPGHAAARSRMALVRIAQHRFAEAESALRGLLADGATAADADPALLHNLALALYHQRRFAEARDCFAQAAQRGLDVPANDAGLARASHHLGDLPAAIEAARRWVERAPGAASRSYLALLHMDGNDTARGEQLAREALAEQPENVDANIVCGLALAEKQDSAQARVHFETALRHEPDSGRAWLGLGLARLHAGEHAGAIEALQRAAEIYPDNPGYVVALGWAHLTARDAAAARGAFEQAVRVDRTFAESHGGLAAALAMESRIAEAREEIQVALRLDRNCFGAQYARAAILAIQGHQAASTSLFVRIFQQSPAAGSPTLARQLQIHSAKNDGPRKPGPP
jgi:tetratricopeptide (TPR) repeat protein